MNASFSDCWAWVFDYLAHRIDRAEAFPAGDKYGAANIACEIIKTLESRITARRYKPVSIYLRFGTTRVKQLRATVDTFPICIPCPLLRREHEKVAAIALALDDAIAVQNQWFLDRGKAIPSLGKDLAKNPVWGRLTVVSLHQSTTQRLCGTSCISEADLRMLSGAANLHDAAASVRSGDYQSAIGLMTGAALLVSGADLPIKLAVAEEKVQKHEKQQANAIRVRHEKTKDLKAKMILLATERHKIKPFTGGHAEVINWLMDDNGVSHYVNEAKARGLKPMVSNASKLLREWLADTSIPKKKTGAGKKAPSN